MLEFVRWSFRHWFVGSSAAQSNSGDHDKADEDPSLSQTALPSLSSDLRAETGCASIKERNQLLHSALVIDVLRELHLKPLLLTTRLDVKKDQEHESIGQC